jgi:hypothetical protein
LALDFSPCGATYVARGHGASDRPFAHADSGEMNRIDAERLGQHQGAAVLRELEDRDLLGADEVDDHFLDGAEDVTAIETLVQLERRDMELDELAVLELEVRHLGDTFRVLFGERAQLLLKTLRHPLGLGEAAPERGHLPGEVLDPGLTRGGVGLGGGNVLHFIHHSAGEGLAQGGFGGHAWADEGGGDPTNCRFPFVASAISANVFRHYGRAWVREGARAPHARSPTKKR